MDRYIGIDVHAKSCTVAVMDTAGKRVSQHVIECLKVSARAQKSRIPRTIGLCQTRNDSLALGLHPSGMRIHVVDEECAACAKECVEWFLDEVPQ